MKRVGISKFNDIENAYILVSAHKKDSKKAECENNLECWMSFLYDAGEIAAEWEPRYGPIQIWYKANDGAATDTKEHYFYDFVIDNPLSWSQLAVGNNGLPQAFIKGDYEHIFDILKDWANK